MKFTVKKIKATPCSEHPKIYTAASYGRGTYALCDQYKQESVSDN